MGIAAYNRGSQVIANQIAADYPSKSREVQIIERINALPKYGDNVSEPFFDVGVVYADLNGWMFGDYDDPFGHVRFYSSLDTTVRSWDIHLIDYKIIHGKGMWITINHSNLENAQKVIDKLNQVN